MAAQVLKGDQSILYSDVTMAPAFRNTLCNDTAGSCINGLSKEVVCVKPLTAQGEKPVTGCDFSGIGTD